MSLFCYSRFNNQSPEGVYGMSGTKAGGLKAAQKNLLKDPDFYKKIGTRGGANGNTGGFASTVIGKDGLTGPERARIHGSRGGKASKKGFKVTVTPRRNWLQRLLG